MKIGRMRIDRVKLIATMAERDMSCTQLAKLTGVSRSTITSVRSGKSCFLETALLIADALRVEVEDLLEERK